MKQFILPISEEQRRLKELRYQLYTDGSCDNVKTRKGGWAAYIVDPEEKTWLLSGSASDTTSSRMELIAVIEGLQWILGKYEPKIRKHIRVSLSSDSKYCINLIKEWLKLWKENGGWEDRPNSDLLGSLDELSRQCRLIPEWNPRNSNEYLTLCDQTANKRRGEVMT